jgi:DNA-binding transcriptional MerR regulator
MDCDRKEGTEWREFSVMDRLWLYTIKALREFGLSLDRVKNAKNIFFSPIRAQEIKTDFLKFYLYKLD